MLRGDVKQTGMVNSVSASRSDREALVINFRTYIKTGSSNDSPGHEKFRWKDRLPGERFFHILLT